MSKPLVAALVAASLAFATPAHARADDGDFEVRFWRTTTIAALAVTAASGAAVGIFAAQAKTAQDGRLEIAGDSRDHFAWKCHSEAECSRMAGLRHDQDRATTNFHIALGIAIPAALLSVVGGICWGIESKRSVHVAPSVGTQSGGLQLMGAF